MTKQCPICGKYFIPMQTGKRKYCSEQCAKDKNNNTFARNLNTLNFNEPMQVELEADGYSDGKLVYDYGKCPKCGWDFEYGDKDWEEPYCCHCGQRLKWFGSEDKE